MTSTTTTATCAGCHKQLGATVYVLDNHNTMCAHCVDSDGLHAQLWPSCRAAWHQPLDHMTDIRFNGTTAL